MISSTLGVGRLMDNTDSIPNDGPGTAQVEVSLDDTKIVIEDPVPPLLEDNIGGNDPTPAVLEDSAGGDFVVPLRDDGATTAQPPAPNNNHGMDESDAQPGTMRFGGAQQNNRYSDLPEICRGASDRKRFQEEEEQVRRNATHNILWLTMVNGYAALKVFIFHLVSLEALVSIALSVSLTVYVYYKTEDDPKFDGNVLDWVLLSFAVITPMSASIGMAFNRRERALAHLVNFRATMIQIYCSHAAWDWNKAGKPDSGRAICDINWQDHGDAALVEILGISHCLSRFLTLPFATRARHRVTEHGRREAEQTLALSSKLYGCMLVRFGRLTSLCEVVKSHGLPPNEATRVRQWERMCLEHADGLRMIKLYRTPQALRSFARLFTVFLPPFYAPSYAEIAKGLDSLGVGICFSVLTSLALTALFETISQMEDPFVGHKTLDGVDVDTELSTSFVAQCMTMRSYFFPTADPFDERRVSTSTCERFKVPEFKWKKLVEPKRPSMKT